MYVRVAMKCCYTIIPMAACWNVLIYPHGRDIYFAYFSGMLLLNTFAQFWKDINLDFV